MVHSGIELYDASLRATGSQSQGTWRKPTWGREAGLQREAEMSTERILDPFAPGTQLHPCPACGFVSYCEAMHSFSFLVDLNWISVICFISEGPDRKQNPL